MSLRWVETASDVAELAGRVVDPARTHAIVCVTTQPYLQRPMLDVDALAARIGDAELWVIARTHHGWELTAALPAELDVYGGASRIWRPIPSLDAVDPRQHPLFTIYSHEDGAAVSDAIVRALRRERVAAPAVGDELDATITQVFAHGAEMELATGHGGYAANAHLASGPVYHAREVVRRGQAVRARVSGAPRTGRDSYMVTLRPFSPDPWQRLGEVYAAGMDVEGVVVGFAGFGAFVELLPGARGLLPNKRVSSDFVYDARDYLEEDDRVVVRVRALDVAAQRAELSLTEVPADARVESVPSLYADGPPWLLPVAEDSPVQAAPVAVELVPERAVVELPPDAANGAPTGTSEPSPLVPDAAAAPVEPSPLAPDPAAASIEPSPVALDPASEAIDAAPVGEPEAAVDAVSAAVAAAEDAQGELASAVSETERQLESLRAQARAIVRDLRDDVAAAELRALSIARDESATVLAEARREIDSLRDQADGLRERLRAAERDRGQLIGQVRHATERRAAGERRVAEAEAARNAARDDAERLRDQLDLIDGSDPARRLVREIHHAWTTSYRSDHDRAAYPFREPTIGPAFVASIEATPGVSRERILEVCAHVAVGRAFEIPSLALHQLHDGDRGDTPARVRDDGATAWRVNLQTKAASARRLHYWQLRDGRVELSKVGVHDDFTIV